MPGILNATEKVTLVERTSVEMAQKCHGEYAKVLAERQAEVDYVETQLKSVREKQTEMQQGRMKAAEQYRKGETTKEQYARDIQFYNTREKYYIEEEKSLMSTWKRVMGRLDLAAKEHEKAKKQEPQQQNAWRHEESRERNQRKEQGR